MVCSEKGVEHVPHFAVCSPGYGEVTDLGEAWVGTMVTSGVWGN